MTDDEAMTIYNDKNRERECTEYHVAASKAMLRINGEEAAPNMLAALLASEAVFLNSHWWEDEWPEDARKTVALCVACNDVFAWACADAENLTYSEIPDLFDYWQKDPEWGTAIWCMKKRNQMPQKPVEKAIRDAGVWDLDSLGIGKNTQDAEVQAMFASLRTSPTA